MKQIEPDDRDLKEALDDKPEDLPKELSRHAEFIRSGQTERAMAIDHEIRSGLAGLLKVEAPQPLLTLHPGLIAYYRMGVSAPMPGPRAVRLFMTPKSKRGRGSRTTS